MRMVPNRSHQDFTDGGSGFTRRCAPADLTDINLTDILLYQTKEFLVINKPCDVRMDGDFPVTIEKLLLRFLDIPARQKDAFYMPRWVHQLDFATSGVLCVALTKRAA